MQRVRQKNNEKIVGLSLAVLNREATAGTPEIPPPPPGASIEEEEEYAMKMQTKNPILLFIQGTIAALKVFCFYLITLDTVVACCLCVGATLGWYWYADQDARGGEWFGGGMDWIILGFAVVTPMTSSLAMAFQRRERALMDISRVRSFSYQIYLAHALWDWPEKGGRAGCTDMNWLEHCDYVMAQLIGIGDDLCRFLSLPTSSRSRHRMTKSGRREAARTVKAAYHLFDSLYTQRMVRLAAFDERLRAAGVGASEISRIRQYERWMGEAMENLRIVKMYRSPQALRSFARIFTLILPAFYAPTFAQLARDVQSLPMGILFGLLIAVGLSGLFNALQVLEDPFVGFITLDGINVTEEFEVLNWQQLINARSLLFPDAPMYPMGRRTALPTSSDIPEIALAQAQARNKGTHHERVVSWDNENLKKIGFGQFAGDIRNEDVMSPVSNRERTNTLESITEPQADLRVSQYAMFLPDDELDDDVAEVPMDEDQAIAEEEEEQEDAAAPAESNVQQETPPPPPTTPSSPTPPHRRTQSTSNTFSRRGSHQLSASYRTRRRLRMQQQYGGE